MSESSCMFGKADSAESSNNSINQPNPFPLRKPETQDKSPFLCSRCSKEFPSLFALGGHQNAHKKERDEECKKAFMERRLAAIEKQRPSSPKPPTAPLAIVPPVFNVINSMPFHGPVVQPRPLMAAAPVLFVPDARFGPLGPTKTSEVVKGGGEGNQYCYHPYKKPVNKQSMALKLFPHHDERDFDGKLAAEEDSACSRYNDPASSTTPATNPKAAPCADHQINTLKEAELDLTLRL